VKPSSTLRAPSGNTKASTTFLSTPSNNASVPKPSISVSLESVPSRTTDPIQIAAQLYPWLYMTSSLEAVFQAAELSAQSTLHERAKELAEEEADIADQRVRFDAEQRVALFDDLASNPLSQELPEIMQTFLRDGDICNKIVGEALQIGTQSQKQPDDRLNLQLHNEILDQLERAHNEANRLEFSIMRLLDSVQLAADSPIRPIFAACLPVVRARTTNLVVAQDLLESSKGNLEMTLQLESLRLTA